MNRVGSKAAMAASSLLLLTLATRAPRADGAPAAPTGKLTAAAASARLAGNTIIGSTPDGPYTEFFAPDGTLTHLDQDGKIGGRWLLRDAQVCLTLPDEDGDDCRAIEVTGNAGAFIDLDGNRYTFEILPGNAKGL